MKYIYLIFFLSFGLLLHGQTNFPQYGKASFYADKFVGKLTASGEKYKHNDMTAAHKSLPFGTKVKVTNLTNGKSVNVRINDRGPYVKDRIIDLSEKAAQKLEFTEIGIVDVKVELLDKAKKENDRKEEVIPEDYSVFTYYKLNASKITPSKYGIQIGSYTDSGNLLKTVHNFQEKFTYDIFVQESVEKGKRKYRLIVGNFSSRKEAESILADLRKSYTDCFVLNLD